MSANPSLPASRMNEAAHGRRPPRPTGARRSLRHAVATVLVLVATAACIGGDPANGSGQPAAEVPTNGLEKKSAIEVHQAAFASLRDAKNVHVTGTKKDHSQDDHAWLDLLLQNGTSIGTVRLKGCEFDVATVSGDVYLRGDQPAWSMLQAPPTVDGSAGGWVKLGPKRFKLDAFTVDNFAAVLADDAWRTATVDQAVLNGSTVVVLSQQNGSRLYVANTGPTYPLRIEDKSSGAQLDFSQYGEDFHLSAPSDAVSNALTPAELVWLDAVDKLFDTMNNAFDDDSVYITSHWLHSMSDKLNGCRRELDRIGLPSQRLQPVHALAQNACAKYEEGARCFATAASIGVPLAGSASDRRLDEALDCGFAASAAGGTLLEATDKGAEIRSQIG